MSAQTWTQKTSIPSKRWNSFCFSLNGQIYMGGGQDLTTSTNYSDLWEYDPASDTWEQKNGLPGNAPLSGVICFTYNDKAYIGLGFSGSQYKTGLYEYDPVNDSWITKSSFPSTGRSGSACFVIDDKAYLVGGFSSTSYAEVWAYDIPNNTWKKKNNYPVNIADAMAFSIDGKGYVCCGDETTGAGICNKTRQYNPVTDTWTSKANFPGTVRQIGIAFVLGAKAYCGLGTSELWAPTYNDLYAYDPFTNSWSPQVSSPISARAGVFACTLDDSKAYIGGGSLDPPALFYDDFYEFEVPVNTTGIEQKYGDEWLSLYPMPSSGEIHLRQTGVEKYSSYKIYDLKGDKILEGQIPQDGTIKTSLTSGIYSISFFSKEASESLRLIIQNE